MARIKRVKESPGSLFVGVTMSGAMHAEVVAMAAEKYDPLLEPLRLKDFFEIPPPHISFVKKKSLEAGVLIKNVDGKCVNVWMTFDLYGRSTDIESFLHLAIERFLPNAGIAVQNGALAGEIILPEEPYRIPTRRNGAMYFLNNEKELALSYLAHDLAVPH